MEKGLKGALTKLNEAIKDLTSLHVQTFTGEVTFTIDENVPEGSTKFDNIKTAVDAAKTAGDIILVAESLYQFDGDSYNFLNNKEGGIPAAALELHRTSVENGIKTRQGLMQIITDVFFD